MDMQCNHYVLGLFLYGGYLTLGRNCVIHQVVRYVLIGGNLGDLFFVVSASGGSSSFFLSDCEPFSLTWSLGNIIAQSSA